MFFFPFFFASSGGWRFRNLSRLLKDDRQKLIATGSLVPFFFFATLLAFCFFFVLSFLEPRVAPGRYAIISNECLEGSVIILR